MKTKLSIIIPVYNGEKNLERCLKSLKHQSEKNFQIIIIDDGSTDNSSDIIKKYSNDFYDFKSLRTKNQGVSSARNLGISMAEGEYLTFLDCDDWLEKEAIKDYYSNFKNNDLIVYRFYSGDSNPQVEPVKKELLKKEDFQLLLLNKKIKGYVWNKIYKTEIIRKNAIEFNPSYQFCEDLDFNIQYSLYCNQITSINKQYYHYMDNDDSITSQNFSEKKTTALDAISNCIKLLETEKGKNAYKNHYYHILISLLVYGKKEKKLNSETEKNLRLHLWDYKISLSSFNKIGLSVVMFRYFPDLSFKVWETLKN